MGSRHELSREKRRPGLVVANPAKSKASGVGREGGEEALRFFTEPKNVCIAK
jgi:acyl-CoA reductase-like NAD-dependent aldehyde dehydrogenase